ncbi:hypothetical protein [Aliidiomarina sanyensis]|uniref:Uncharacterized protein n=1 Tax=Aliidiomarina sanyensis TaxID=1249555 RepID=A0A432WK94_9GAMM|nr:hypothetical protein [Aliidiomarina sanyensis]RUO34178.1 hypothetical protein CWE11_05470 [Aliidiomarina sanyensis]
MHRIALPTRIYSPFERYARVVALVLASFLMFGSCLVMAQDEEPKEQTEVVEPKTESRATEVNLEWLDSFQDGVEDTVDATARWFDQFFGDERSFDDTEGSRGRISLRPEWSQYDGFRVRSSLRAQFTLPNTEERLSAIIGRVDFDDFVTGEDSQQRSSVIRSETGDEEWIIGLGFDPRRGETSRFSVSAGIRGGLRADLYVQGRYLYQYRISDSKQIRSRSSLFWRDSDGFGLNQRLDIEHSPNPEWLNRLSMDATRAERVQGYRWRSSIASYHVYEPEKAMAVEFFWRGETKQLVPLRDYGFRLIHRRGWLREWLFLETYAGLHWPRRELDEPRRGRYMIGLEIEMWFGD